MNGTSYAGSTQKSLKRFVATWDYTAQRQDELSLSKGDILLVAEEYDDGWLRGLRLKDLEVGFFPENFVAEELSPLFVLQDIHTRCKEAYMNDPKFSDMDNSRRSKISLEMFTSEQTYMKKLKMLKEKFVDPLKVQNVIPQEDYGPVFSHVLPLCSLSQTLTVHFKSRVEAWDERHTRLGDVFLHMGAHLKLFVTYAVHHTLGRQVLMKISKQEKFQKWLEKTELECQRTLDSLLVEPIQRVPRYELLLKDLLKHTAEDHPDFPSLRDALALVQKIAFDCNESIRRAENELHLFTISRRFPNDDVDIVQAKKFYRRSHKDPVRGSMRRKATLLDTNTKNNLNFKSFFDLEHPRKFVKEGAILKGSIDFSDSSERYLFLCSDVLLIAQATNKSRRTFKLKERVKLVHAWLTDTLMSSSKMPDRGFILGTPSKMHRFIAASVEEKTTWYTELHKLIHSQKQLFSKLLTHLSIPDELYTCNKFKAKVHYLGMLQDELSFQAGDEVMVVGYKEKDGRWRPGLYTEEPFDPSPEWYFGIHNDNCGWFPAQCVASQDSKSPEPASDELVPAPMYIIRNLKQRMVDLTGREIPPLRDNERVSRVYTGDGTFKTLRVPVSCDIEDIVRLYFKTDTDPQFAWSLIEMSTDETVQRILDPFEDPGKVMDFWGKSRDNMKFFLRQTVTSNLGDSD